jgi:hypothetical protein
MKASLTVITVALVLISCASHAPRRLADPTGFPFGKFRNQQGDAFEFMDGGRYCYPLVAVGLGLGEYTLEGNQICMSALSAHPDADCFRLRGCYTWTYTGDVIKFKVLEDDCGRRRMMLTGAGLERIP